MILCQHLSSADLARIGDQIADAFAAEPGAFAKMEKEAVRHLFRCIVKTCYQSGHLYTTSEKQEGFCVYWTKKQRPGLWPQLQMALKMSCSLPVLRASRQMGANQNNWTPTEKRYRKAHDFVEVFLLAVRKEYQGQGHFRRMLEEPFKLAETLGTICVLDTDSAVKAQKYCHVGMHIIDQKPQRSGIEMFALEK